MNNQTKQALPIAALVSLLLSNGPVLAQPAAVSLGHKGPINAIAFSPDGTKLASAGEDGTVRLWEVATGKQLYRWAAHNGMVICLAYHPRGTVIVSGGNDHMICTLDPATGKRFCRFEAENGPVNDLTFSDDKEYAFFASCVSGVQIRQGRFGLLWHAFQKEARSQIVSVSFAPGGKLLASGALDGGITLWSLVPDKTGRVKPAIKQHLGRHPGGIRRLMIGPDGKYLAVGGEDAFTLWDLTKMEKVHSWKILMYSNPVFVKKANVVIASFGESVRAASGATLATPHVATVWSVATKKVVRKLPEASRAGAIALSPDERILATAYYDRIRLWDWTTGVEVFLWKK